MAALAQHLLPAMEHFPGAGTVRLRSHNGRYLTAVDDEKSVKHKTDGTARAACWSVEPVRDSVGFVRFRSCVGLLLTASDSRFLLGATGFKVLQTNRNQNNSSVEWQPLRDEASDAPRFRLRSRRGTFLRGNGGKFPPYKGSVTHDDPVLSYSQAWVLWEVEIVERRAAVSPPRPIAVPSPSVVSGVTGWETEPSEPSSPEGQVAEGSNNGGFSGEMSMGRTIHYQVVDERGEVDPDYPEGTLMFRGSSLQELARKIEDRTGIPDVILCIQDATRFNKLQKIRLALPPHRLSMTIFVVSSSSPVAKTLY